MNQTSSIHNMLEQQVTEGSFCYAYNLPETHKFYDTTLFDLYLLCNAISSRSLKFSWGFFKTKRLDPQLYFKKEKKTIPNKLNWLNP